MLRKFSHFTFNGPKYGNKHLNQADKIVYQAQIYVYGAYAKEVLIALNPSFKNIESREAYAVKYMLKADLMVDADVTVHSNIQYDEKHKRKANTIVFNHTDEVDTNICSGVIRVESMNLSEFDLNDAGDKFVLIADEDNDKVEQIVRSLQGKITHLENVQCVYGYPYKREGNSFSWDDRGISDALANIGIDISTSVVSTSSETLSGVVRLIESVAVDRIKMNADKYLENQKNQLTESMKDEIIQQFSDELHAEAEEYFKIPWYRK